MDLHDIVPCVNTGRWINNRKDSSSGDSFAIEKTTILLNRRFTNDAPTAKGFHCTHADAAFLYSMADEDAFLCSPGKFTQATMSYEKMFEPLPTKKDSKSPVTAVGYATVSVESILLTSTKPTSKIPLSGNPHSVRMKRC
jgi:hypothetical protein